MSMVFDDVEEDDDENNPRNGNQIEMFKGREDNSWIYEHMCILTTPVRGRPKFVLTGSKFN